MAGRRNAAAEAEVEGAVEDTAPEVEAEQPTEDVEAAESEGQEPEAADVVEDAHADESDESDEGAERTAVAHIAFMDGHELVRFAPGDTIPSKYADRVTSAKAVSE